MAHPQDWRLFALTRFGWNDLTYLLCSAQHAAQIDGLDKPWGGINVPTSVWDDALGQLDGEDIAVLPMAIR